MKSRSNSDGDRSAARSDGKGRGGSRAGTRPVASDSERARRVSATRSRAIHEAIAVRSRMARALDLVPAVTEARRSVLTGWLELMPIPEGPDGSLSFRVGTDARCARHVWSASGSTAFLTDLVIDLFSALGVSSEACVRFQLALAQLRPRRIETWLEISERGFDGGWTIRTPMPLDRAQSFAPMSEPLSVLSAWAGRHELDTCSLLSRSVGEGTPYTDVVLPLPPGDADGALAIAVDAMSALGVTALPSEARDAIVMAGPEQLGLSVRLFDGGIAKLGIVVPDPSRELVTRLAGQCEGSDLEAISMLEGVLRSGLPRYAQFALVATGHELELNYSPRGSR